MTKRIQAIPVVDDEGTSLNMTIFVGIVKNVYENNDILVYKTELIFSDVDKRWYIYKFGAFDKGCASRSM